MDNTMTAVISTIMITFGFVTGLIVSDLLHIEYIGKLRKTIANAVDIMLEKDQEIDDLKLKLDQEKDLNLELIECLAREKQRTLDVLASVKGVVDEYDECLPRVLEPPRGPLKRSRACMEDSDSEDENEYPISPDLVLNSKD